MLTAAIVIASGAVFLLGIAADDALDADAQTDTPSPGRPDPGTGGRAPTPDPGRPEWPTDWPCGP